MGIAYALHKEAPHEWPTGNPGRAIRAHYPTTAYPPQMVAYHQAVRSVRLCPVQTPKCFSLPIDPNRISFGRTHQDAFYN